jgi:hypothetical protein
MKSDLWEAIKYMRSPNRIHDFIFVDSFMKWCAGLLVHLSTEKGLTGFDLYGAFGKKTLAAINKLKELTNPAMTPSPVNAIVTWGCEMGADWEGKRTYQPLVDGKQVSPRLPYEFDNVLWMFKETNAQGKVEYVCHTVGSDKFDAKINAPSGVTIPGITARIINPNLHEIISSMEGYCRGER